MAAASSLQNSLRRSVANMRRLPFRTRKIITRPCVRWLQTLVNRVDPILFGRCFESWIKALWPDRHDLITIDGKTSADKTKRSVKTRRKSAGWNPNYLLQLLQLK